MQRMDKPNFLGKQGMYSSFVSVILLWKLVFQFLTRRGFRSILNNLLILFFKHETELEWSWTDGSVIRKAGKAQQLSLCCSVSVPHAQKLGELAGVEERCHCCSQRSRRALGAKAMQPGKNPALPSSNPSLVLPFRSPAIKLRLDFILFRCRGQGDWKQKAWLKCRSFYVRLRLF